MALYCRCQQIWTGDLTTESLWSYPLSHNISSTSIILLIKQIKTKRYRTVHHLSEKCNEIADCFFKNHRNSSLHVGLECTVTHMKGGLLRTFNSDSFNFNGEFMYNHVLPFLYDIAVSVNFNQALFNFTPLFLI